MPAVYGAIYAAIVGVVLIVVLTIGADWFPFSYVVFHGFLPLVIVFYSRTSYLYYSVLFVHCQYFLVFY